MSKLRDQIQSLANDFAASIVKALTGASFSDIASLTSGGGRAGTPAAPSRKRARRAAARPAARPAAAAAPAAPKAAAAPAAAGKAKKVPKPTKPLKRRGPEEISKIIARITDLLAKNPNGLRAEDIGKRLAMHSRELPRPLHDALEARKISKKGQKRATTYFLPRK